MNTKSRITPGLSELLICAMLAALLTVAKTAEGAPDRYNAVDTEARQRAFAKCNEAQRQKITDLERDINARISDSFKRGCHAGRNVRNFLSCPANGSASMRGNWHIRTILEACEAGRKDVPKPVQPRLF